MNKTIKFLTTLLLLAVSVGAWADETTIEYQFTSKDWASQTEVNGQNVQWISGKAGAGFSNGGIQVTTAATGANGTCPNSYDNISKIVVTYNTNKSKGAGSIVAKIGNNDAKTNSVAYSGSVDGTTANFTTEFTYDTPQTGTLKLTVNTTTNSIYLCKVAITYNPSSSSAVATTTTIDASDITNTDVNTSTTAGSLSATVSAGGNAISGATVSWSSSNTSVATIDENGAITLVAAGTTTIMASYAGVTDQYQASYATYDLTVTSSAPVIDYATLPFNWEGGASADFLALNGVIANGLGSDYASNNAPYLIKLDGTGDYIQVKTDSQPGKVTIGVKMLGGGNTSTITVQGSADGETFTDIQELSISGAQNAVLTLETTNSFAATDRYVRLLFTKGSNVGVGPITIALPSTDPVINASDINLSYGSASGNIQYTIDNPVDGGALSASTDSDWLTISYELGNWMYNATENTTASERTATVTLTYTYNTNQTVTKEITVTQAGNPNAPGTENNPYTVAQALGATPADNVYVQGTISTITEVSAEHGNATYRISDDGTTANEMIIFRGKYLNNVAFTSDDQIAVGDVVKVYGKLSNYHGANQMAQGNYIVTLQGSKPSPVMSFPEESYSATLGETFTAPALTITPNTLTVTYSSSDTSVATVNETSGEVTLVAAGETTITATFAGNDDYRSATASYDLTVTDPNAPNGTIDNPYRVQDVIDGTATGNNVYVKGYIVGEYVGNTTDPRTSGFTTDANIAIADVFTTAPTASGSIPVQLPTNALKNAWGNQTKNGEFITYEVLLKGNVETYFSVNGIKGTSEVTATGVYVKIASSGKSSYCASHDIELVDGVNAYIVTNVTSTSATMTQLTGAVPANVGIMLVGTGGAEYTLPIATEATEAASVSGNMLIGTASGENVQEEAGKTYLALKNGEFVVMNPGTVKPHKAYLSVDSSVIGNNSKLAITYEENNATAINEVQTTKEDGVFYNLNGMRVSAPQKGIYILNGKKIIVK